MPHRADERLRQALHLADLVDEMNCGALARAVQRSCKPIDGRHVDAVFAHARRGQIDVRDDRRFARERDETESPSLAAGTDLLGIESGQTKSAKALTCGPQGSRLADAGPSCQEQRHNRAYRAAFALRPYQ